ncbi:MAG: P1 family peptidase [Alphaproteobacteria bacterium]
MIRPGPMNLITDVEGVRVGNADDPRLRSGVTVVLPDEPAVAGVDVRGGAPGTRESDILSPQALLDRVDAVVLSGGSAFGLDAASGVMAWLRGRGRGHPVGDAIVPIVPAAILFDLLNGGDKDWGEANPYAGLGRKACAAANKAFGLGNAGAGLGARAGPLKGGLGSASAVDETGLSVGAIVAVNAVGSPVMPGQPTLWAWSLEQGDELGGQPAPTGPSDLEPELHLSAHTQEDGGIGNTVIGVVATNAHLDKAQAGRVALMAHDGIARALRPAHTPLDGDVIFCLATGRGGAGRPDALALARLGAVGADCVARATARGVYAADPLGRMPGYRAIHGAHLKGGRGRP